MTAHQQTAPALRHCAATAGAPTEIGAAVFSSPEPSADHRLATGGLVWVDLLKAVALIWICLNHLTERLFGFPYIGNPSAAWPPLAERVAQLQPLHGYGWWGVPLNLLRYAGWAGDQGVQLFVILSGFGLTWGLLRRQGRAPLGVWSFYVGRVVRIYPLWCVAHLALLVVSLLLGKGALLNEPAFYLSLAGVRVTPGLLYYLVPAWWYIGLLIQLCLIYPLLWEGLRRRGPLWLLLVSCGVSVVVRGAGLLLLQDGVDAWARGAIFITRLPEFVCGVSVAAWLFDSPTGTDARLRSWPALVLAVAAYAVATLLSLSRIGMTVAPATLGAAAFVVLYALLARVDAAGARHVRPWVWIGRHSYSLFLVHQPVIAFLVPSETEGGHAGVFVAATAAAALLTVIGALAVERAAEVLVGLVRGGGRARAARVAAGIGLLFATLVGADQVIRSVDPQEALGWGERPSLKPDATVGWRLRPSRRTHLRWESYDYHVTANALGFPGPEYQVEKPAGAVRILVTGDAFTSAEGVDTEEAWPRLLETDLAQVAGRTVQVLNFGITGYGPNQYAAVIGKFAPIYRPDLIVIGLFVNDFEDALIGTAAFHASIGFDQPPPDGWVSALTLAHVRQWLKLHVGEQLFELVRRRPGPHGYFLGQFSALERDRSDLRVAGRQRVAERLAEIARVARTVGARVLVAMIPAPVQVCGPNDLAYYPRYVDIGDARRFDLDGPQRLARDVAETLELGFCDLRPALLAAPDGCPYQSHNLHWTAAGHRAVAHYLAQYLFANAFVDHQAEG